MIISASILNSDLCNIEETVKLLEENKIKALHFDVMDGSFVDNISFGIPVLESIRRITDMFIDVHLMINNPKKHIEKFVNAGADLITFHLEAVDSPEEAEEIIEKIHSYDKKAGVAINPSTDAFNILRFSDIADLLLVMSVEPGLGGQKFMEESLPKLGLIKSFCNLMGYSVDIQVDGGINDKTAELAIDAGANNLVSGSYLINFLKNLDWEELILKISTRNSTISGVPTFPDNIIKNIIFRGLFYQK
ncbi:ribulose-phosphate 3-epimerase [Clostridia bacterium]|nr:ribulose-phosphate 3-epimerase [Clostridia bacterium]